MEDKKIIQDYIDNFKYQISGILKPDIGISAIVYPCKEDGAIIEFLFGTGIKSKIEFKDTFSKISDALKTINQKAFGGNFDGFIFKETNYIMEFQRLILIKDNSSSEWTMKKAYSDVLKFITASK